MMTSPFSFNTTPQIVFAPHSAERLGAIAATRLGAAVLVITDPELRRLGLCDPAIADLQTNDCTVTVFDAVEADPSRETLMKAVAT
ncbi:MAG: iron-containing alcohol dehydrogenase, partial [Paracoccus sp. (in: a-proteobacteria)]|nr:iron-containing alcohol dehydrogenase [Paracoccus sp. (in: a-proteobacteria)]